MARVFLLNPPGGEPVRSPLLAFCHLAASLRAGGHEVALHDGCATHAVKQVDQIATRIAAFAPDLIGVHIKTLHAQDAYRIAPTLAAIAPLCAGGPHATICPDEVLTHGFSFAVRGEGEETLVELADALDQKRALADVRSLTYLANGRVAHNPGRGFLLDLDALAAPLSALDLFDPAWYAPPGQAPKQVPPAGVLASRGCPAACTFCSNNVTGRRFRYRSATAIVKELAQYKRDYGQPAFSFFDDSFAVGKRRMEELCAALTAEGGLHWTCTAHPSHLDRGTLLAMQRAGCGGVDIGMESADPGMLLRIGKGVTVERVIEVLRECHSLGLHAIVNLMFGWPDETEAELDKTIEFMEMAAPFAGGFNARGVVVPYPGTEIYDLHHERFGFTRWWIDEPPLDYPVFPTTWSYDEVVRAYAADPALDRNFFRHSDRVREKIATALRRKAELTYRRLGYSPSEIKVPAAGAR